MTNYTDVISLEQAKLYLRIDDDQTVTDDEITQMINSALSFIEKRTNHIFKTRDKVYYKDCALVQQVKVYDYPIDNSETELNIKYRPLYAIVPTVNDVVTLTVGYSSFDDIPGDLIDSGLQIIKVWFYEGEKQTNTSLIPLSVMQAIDVNRRFI
jgi:Phage gp6-like head-tail connector protein